MTSSGEYFASTDAAEGLEYFLRNDNESASTLQSLLRFSMFRPCFLSSRGMDFELSYFSETELTESFQCLGAVFKFLNVGFEFAT